MSIEIIHPPQQAAVAQDLFYSIQILASVIVDLHEKITIVEEADKKDSMVWKKDPC